MSDKRTQHSVSVSERNEFPYVLCLSHEKVDKETGKVLAGTELIGKFRDEETAELVGTFLLSRTDKEE